MKILIVGLNIPPPEFLKKLSETFSAKIFFSEDKIPKSAFDGERNQFSAEKILNYIRTKEFDADKVLCVCEEDIFVRGLNFVFGLSEIGGKNCIVSFHRLHPEFYGEKNEKMNEKLFEERALKECIHELGHLFNLEHCSKKSCVMSFSNSISEVDKKSSKFCENCTKKLSLF